MLLFSKSNSGSKRMEDSESIFSRFSLGNVGKSSNAVGILNYYDIYEWETNN